MGAINFRGGSWCGGGYGKIYEDEYFKYEDEFGKNEINHDLQKEVYDNLESSLKNIEDYIIKNIKGWVYLGDYDCEKTFRTTLSDLLEVIQWGCGGFLSIECGYYEGFQIYMHEPVSDAVIYNHREEEFYFNNDVKKYLEKINNFISTLNLSEYEYL